MAVNIKRVVLNPRAYLTPFALLVVLHHVPVLIAYAAISRPHGFHACERLHDLFRWLDVAFILHVVTAVLLIASATVTLCSSVYRVHKPENLAILVLFLLYVALLVWGIYGEGGFPADTSGCSNDSDAIQDAADHITYFQHFDFVFSLVVVILATCSSYLCGVHAGSDAVEAEKRWQRRCMNMFRIFTCHSTRSHATDDDMFESLGKMLGKFFVVRYKTKGYEGLQFNDLMFCLGLVSRGQRHERDDVHDDEVASRTRFPNSTVEETKLRDVSFYARLAIGMYGWPMYVWYTPLKWFRAFRCCASKRGRGETQVVEHDNVVTSNRSSFVSYTGIDADALVYLNCYNFVFSAPYSIVKDQTRRELIISVRGSFSFYDFITDGLAHIVNMERDELPENVPDRDATATHYGMLRTARSLFGDLQEGTRQSIFWDFAMEHCQAGAKEPWTIVVTGHSMGAGVGSVLCILLRRLFPSTRAFLYAPPMMFDPVTAQWTKSFMTTAVFSDDIVPRLSIANVMRLRDEMVNQFNAVAGEKLYKVRYSKHRPIVPKSTRVGALEIDATASTVPGSPDPAPDGAANEPTTNGSSSDDKSATESHTGLLGLDFLQTTDLDDVQEVDVPGEIIHILTVKPARTCGCTMLRGEQELTYTLRDASYFRRIWVNSRALQDHMVHHYDRNVRHLTANCLGISIADEGNQILIDIDPEEANNNASAEVQVGRPPVTLEEANEFDVIGDFEPTAATDANGRLRIRETDANTNAESATPYQRMDDAV